MCGVCERVYVYGSVLSVLQFLARLNLPTTQGGSDSKNPQGSLHLPEG